MLHHKLCSFQVAEKRFWEGWEIVRWKSRDIGWLQLLDFHAQTITESFDENATVVEDDTWQKCLIRFLKLLVAKKSEQCAYLRSLSVLVNFPLFLHFLLSHALTCEWFDVCCCFFFLLFSLSCVNTQWFRYWSCCYSFSGKNQMFRLSHRIIENSLHAETSCATLLWIRIIFCFSLVAFSHSTRQEIATRS